MTWTGTVQQTPLVSTQQVPLFYLMHGKILSNWILGGMPLTSANPTSVLTGSRAKQFQLLAVHWTKQFFLSKPTQF
jgi:hypothetical protein